MKALEYRCFKVFIVVFQLYLSLEAVQTLHYFKIIHLPYNVYATLCFASLLFAVGNAFLFYLTLYLNVDLGFIKRVRSLAFSCLPMLAAILLLTISIFNGIVFKIEDNVMVKGRYYLLLPVFSFMYLLLAARISLKKAKEVKTSKARREAVSTVALILFLIVWTIIDNNLS